MSGRRSIVVLAAWCVVAASLALAGSDPSVLALGGIVAVIGTAVFASFDLLRCIAPAAASTRNADRDRWRRRSDDDTAMALRNALHRARRSGSVDLRDALVDLIDERLLTVHRIDRTTDPEAAHAVLAPSLRRLVADPSRPLASVRELRRALTDIEAL